ncbi:hypothetical protein L208DRAFT_1229583 [Tricholoma matsutake]|nr:hypothetical protein L208DRAFT_1229583 [Tricholoma matsutake 945]
MCSFGQTLHDAHEANPGRCIITFKSDVSTAFLNLPAHPIFQSHQVVNIEGKLYIVWHLVFGNRASPWIWCAVSGLLCWLTIQKFDIHGLHVYMDNFFGWEFADHFIEFRGKKRPPQQAQLLILWEHISCPFEDKKQNHGELLKIIGFWVDANQGSISLPPSSVSDLISKIDSFSSWNPTLREQHCLAGHLNWLLNVLPWGCVLPWGHPALMELYCKMSGKSHPFGGIPINAVVTSDLSWLKAIIPHSIGIHFADSGLWSDSEADIILWTDTSLTTALSFVYANQGFVYQICTGSQKVNIFFLELMVILCGIHHIASFAHPPR